MLRRAALILLTCSLGACSPSAEQAWQLTAQGMYTGSISPDAEYALVGSLNHGASLWRITDYERLFDWNHSADQPVELVAATFSPDGKTAVTTDPRTLVVWDTATGQSLQFWGTPGSVLDAKVVPGTLDVLLGLDDHSAIVFDASSGRHRHSFLTEGQVTTVDVSRDGRLAATGSDDHFAVIWSLETGEALQRIDLGNPVRKVALSPDGQTLLAAASKSQVGVWDVQSGKLLYEFYDRSPGITSASFSQDGTKLLLGTVNRTVELWNVSAGNRVQRWQLPAKNPWKPAGSAVLALAFTSQPGRFKALAGDGQLLALRLERS